MTQTYNYNVNTHTQPYIQYITEKYTLTHHTHVKVIICGPAYDIHKYRYYINRLLYNIHYTDIQILTTQQYVNS